MITFIKGPGDRETRTVKPEAVGPDGDPAAASAAPPPSVILYYMGVGRRHALIIAAILAVALVGSLIFTLFVTPLYTAQVRIEIAREETNVTNVKGLEPDSVRTGVEFYATQYSLLSSRSMAERVSRRLKLSTDDAFLSAYGLKRAPGQLFSTVDGQSSAAALRATERQVVDVLVGNIMVKPVRASSLADIAFTSPSPALAAEISNAWVEEFVNQSMDRRLMSTASARSFLEKRLREMRQRLEKSDSDRVNFLRANAIVSLDVAQSADGATRTTRTLVSSDLEALNRELIVATAARIQAEGQYDAARRPSNADGMLQTAATGQLRQRRTELVAERAKLLVMFDPEFPEVRAAAKQIAAFDASLKAEQRDALVSISATLQSARIREITLRRRVGEMLRRYDAQSRASTQSNIYQREVDTNRQLYDALLQRYKEIGIAAVAANNISVVDVATVPRVPTSPTLMLNLAVALLGGLMAAGAAVVALENLDERIRTPQRVSEMLGMSLLGAPPWVTGEAPYIALNDPKSAISEAYLTVRTNLTFATDHGAPRSFCVASTTNSEGKSITSLALALMLARSGRSVVLVDADMRRPSLAKILGHANAPGLSNFLAGDDNWPALVLPTDHSGVSLLPAGPSPPSAPDLLSTDRLAELVRALAERYDHVIFDSPPMRGLSDATLIARVVEGIVFVIKAEATPLKAVHAAVQRFHDNKVRIFGAVLTNFNASGSDYSYDYQYDYSNVAVRAKRAGWSK